MNESQARQILGDAVQEDNSLYSDHQYIDWDGIEIELSGVYLPEYLAALSWWVNNMTVTEVEG